MLFNFKTNKEKNTDGHSEEYIIRLNYGIVNIEQTPEIKNLYHKFNNKSNEANNSNTSGLALDGDKKHIFIINDTQEKFLFKSFSSPSDLSSYIEDLDNGDYFQDMNFAFKHFAEYNVNHAADLFYKERYFSITKTLINPIYSMMQGGNVLLYFLLIISNIFVLKYDNTVSIK